MERREITVTSPEKREIGLMDEQLDKSDMQSCLDRWVDVLKSSNIRHIVYLPETWLAPLIERLVQDPEFISIPVAREDEGIGVCAGLELGGENAALFMQNTGLLASANAITALALKHRIPLLMVISDRGAPGWRDRQDYHLLEGEVTHPVLAALRVPIFEIHTPSDVTRIGDAHERATLGNQPVAVLVTQGALVS
jgi:sulfopyruvate decarboxylase subunit alpha